MWDQKRVKKPWERPAKTPEKALAILMWICSRAEKSSGDALRLMRLWKVDPEEQPKVLEKLIEEKFIDDARYAKAYVREKSRLSGWGEHRIRYQLSLKGVSRDVIADTMFARQENGENNLDRLEELMRRKLRGLRTADKFEIRNKLFRYGASLGHDSSNVIKIINKITTNEE